MTASALLCEPTLALPLFIKRALAVSPILVVLSVLPAAEAFSACALSPQFAASAQNSAKNRSFFIPASVKFSAILIKNAEFNKNALCPKFQLCVAMCLEREFKACRQSDRLQAL